MGMTDIVFAHEGTVAKIKGDALHVLFGAPGEQLDRAARAVSCALTLDEYAESFRVRWIEKGIALGVTRIGVHAGPAIVGNFGGGRFFDYTAHGDTINTAARLEAANKHFGTRRCASATLATRVPNFRGRLIGDLVLRGKTETMRTFEPVRAEKFDDPATDSYSKAIALLEVNDARAIAALATHVGKWPNDQLASFHLKRLLNGATGTRIELG
jgi:adenylate cyclase